VPGFTLFAFLWCVAILFHQGFQGRFLVLDGTSFLTFAALWGMLRPSSLARFLVVVAVQLVTVAAEMPKVVNHWMLMGVTCFGLLVALAPNALDLLRRRPVRPLPSGLLESVQAQIIIVYAMATLAKLNAGFFDPAYSCGAEHYRRLAASVPIFPQAPWAVWTAILGTLVIEAALPLALFFRRTRVLALFGGWVFHLMLGFNGYWDFSTVGVAYYSAFVPAALLSGGRRAFDEHALLARTRDVALRVSASPWSFPVAALLLLVPAGLATLSEATSRELVLGANAAGRWIWLTAWLALGAALTLATRHATRETGPAAPVAAGWWRHPALALGPALVLLNGFSPYLGLKTEHSYTMFSNIRTEGGEWNHYVMPRGLRVFGFQDEPIVLVRSSDPYLKRLARSGYRLVPFALRSYAEDRPGMSLVYETVEGQRREGRVRQDPELSQGVNPLLAKLMLFRPVPPPERNECLH